MQQGLQESKRVFRTSDGTELTLLSAQRANAARQNVAQLVDELPKRPEPAHAIRDFERGRPLSFEKYVQVETAVIRKSSAAALVRYFGRALGNAVEHIVAPIDHLDNVLDHEADCEHEANKQQRRLTLYIQTNNRTGIERVRDSAAIHALALSRVAQTADVALRVPVGARNRAVVMAMGRGA